MRVDVVLAPFAFMHTTPCVFAAYISDGGGSARSRRLYAAQYITRVCDTARRGATGTAASPAADSTFTVRRARACVRARCCHLCSFGIADQSDVVVDGCPTSDDSASHNAQQL